MVTLIKWNNIYETFDSFKDLMDYIYDKKIIYNAMEFVLKYPDGKTKFCFNFDFREKGYIVCIILR